MRGAISSCSALAAVLVLCPATDASVGASISMGSLATQEGGNPIFDFELRQMLDNWAPTGTPHSMLLVFTQCFGGDHLDNYAGRGGTAVLSATSAGEFAYYGGYHDDAAAALRPTPGRTSADVHAAGIAGKNPKETPVSIGPVVPMEPTGPGLTIDGRRVVVYAGQPAPDDIQDRTTLEQGFAGAYGTTFTSVGGPVGGVEWDQPGTLVGLRSGLYSSLTGGTGTSTLAAGEQVVLFVTDHGGYHVGVEDLVVPPPPAPGGEETITVQIPLNVAKGMIAAGSQNEFGPDGDPATGVHLFAPAQAVPYAKTDLSIRYDKPGVGAWEVEYWRVFQIDLNGDGDSVDAGEGQLYWFPIDEPSLLPLPLPAAGPVPFTFKVVNKTPATMAFDFAVVASGPLPKTRSVSVSGVPTLSDWGMIALAGSLAAGGVWMGRPRRVRP